MVQLQRLAQHKFRLRHRPLKRIHHQHNAIYHFQHAFHFAAKIGMSRCIYNIDFHIAILHGCIFGKYSYAALPFDIAAIHHPLLYHLICAESSALAKQLVYKRSFPMVNMGDNCDISD